VNANQDPPDATLRGRWLLAARAGWVAVTTLTLALVAAGFVVGLDRPDLIPRPSARAVFADAGVADQVTDVVFLIVLAAYTAAGLLIFWRRSKDWAAMLFALMLMTAGVVPVSQEWALERAVPWLELPVRLVWLLAMFVWLVVLFVFPDGRFVPGWTRLLGAAAVPAAVLLVDFPRLLEELPAVSVRFGLAVLIFSVFWGAGLYAQVYRYRHVSGPEQQQQTKWVALTLGLLFLLILVGVFIPSLFTTSNAWFFWVLLAELAAMLLFPASVAVAILRHHLYDIDHVISRTLTYGLLTVLLGGAYAATVLLLGHLFGGINAQPPSWAVAGATLAVAAVFRPARRRIQAVVDRRFNRRKYDAAKTVEAFSRRLREEVDLDALSAELLGVVDQTVQPTNASLWLRPSMEPMRPTGV
jgi:hypothetical protein